MNMVNRQLFEQWRVRLAEWQEWLDQGRPRPWLAKAYVRVLSFLLKQYVPGDNAAESLLSRKEEDTLRSPRSAMQFVMAAPEATGKPPRGRDDIRSVLEAVRAKAPRVDRGPLASGLRADDPIVIASFYHPGLAVGVQQDLRAAGIAAERNSCKRQTQVVIRAEDLERAKLIVAAHAAFYRDSSRSRRRYTTLYASIGGIAGATSQTVCPRMSHAG